MRNSRNMRELKKTRHLRRKRRNKTIRQSGGCGGKLAEAMTSHPNSFNQYNSNVLPYPVSSKPPVSQCGGGKKRKTKRSGLRKKKRRNKKRTQSYMRGGGVLGNIENSFFNWGAAVKGVPFYPSPLPYKQPELLSGDHVSPPTSPTLKNTASAANAIVV